jgi:hypothetical protein
VGALRGIDDGGIEDLKNLGFNLDGAIDPDLIGSPSRALSSSGGACTPHSGAKGDDSIMKSHSAITVPRSRYSRLSPMPYYSRCHRMDQFRMCFPGSPSGSAALLPLSSTTPSLCYPMLTNMLCQ